jgi:hypothetical protein
MLHVGLDIHSKHIVLCVLSQTGQVVQRARVRGLEELLRLLKGLPDRFAACTASIDRVRIVLMHFRSMFSLSGMISSS